MKAVLSTAQDLRTRKNFWTDSFNFSLKAAVMVARQFNVTLSCQRANAGHVRVMMYDAGMYWDNGRWHVEGEFLRKFYADGEFRPVNAADSFVSYRIPFHKGIRAISFLGRYDYMSDHSNGNRDDSGLLTANDSERHRLTAGTTLSLGHKALQADVRQNYERYFYAADVIPAVSEQDKLVLEFVVHF